LSFPTSDGWLTIENAIGMSSCNPTETSFDVLDGVGLTHLRQPDWLKKPNFEALRGVQALPVETPPLPPPAVPPFVSSPAIVSEVEPESAYAEVVDREIETSPRAVLIPAISNTPAPTKLPIIEPLPEPAQISEPVPTPEVISAPIAEPIQENIQTVELHSPPPLTKYEVQLGAYDGHKRSLRGWEELTAQVPYLSDQLYRVEAAVIETGDIVYRLRVMGFSKFSTAIKFCDKLKSDDVDCYAVKAE